MCYIEMCFLETVLGQLLYKFGEFIQQSVSNKQTNKETLFRIMHLLIKYQNINFQKYRLAPLYKTRALLLPLINFLYFESNFSERKIL